MSEKQSERREPVDQGVRRYSDARPRRAATSVRPRLRARRFDPGPPASSRRGDRRRRYHATILRVADALERHALLGGEQVAALVNPPRKEA